MAFLSYLHKVVDGEVLSSEEAYAAMSLILEGQASTARIAALMVATKLRGEVASELVGYVRAMRERMARVKVSGLVIDTCGTGGDGLCTFNISTIAAFVAAGAGVRVAKHGGRSASGTFGSADLLEALGIPLDLTPAEASAAIEEVGIGFLFAQAHHPAMRHAREARVELKMRSVFNLLGPLSNPAAAPRQLIGAPSERAAELMASALTELGTERTFVVHGHDGLDEISTTGETTVFEVCGDEIRDHLWTPADFGVPRATLSQLVPASKSQNLEIAQAVLAGKSGPERDIVLVNAAAALLLAGRVNDLRAGVRAAAESIDSGAARTKLAALAAFRHPQPRT